MTILGWRKKYSDILKEFKYDEKKDKESAIILDSILEKSNRYSFRFNFGKIKYQ
jgi:uncharacterized Rossmann fold enzyme